LRRLAAVIGVYLCGGQEPDPGSGPTKRRPFGTPKASTPPAEQRGTPVIAWHPAQHGNAQHLRDLSRWVSISYQDEAGLPRPPLRRLQFDTDVGQFVVVRASHEQHRVCRSDDRQRRGVGINSSAVSYHDGVL
jgi:hypothetical protein